MQRQAQKRIVSIIPTKVKRHKERANRRQLEEELAQERQSAALTVQAAKKRAGRQNAKNAVKQRKAKARVAVDDGQQEIELESGEDVDSGEDDEYDDSARPAESPAAAFCVLCNDKRVVSANVALHMVLSMLREMGGYEPVDIGFIALHTGVDARLPENARFLDTLRRCSALYTVHDQPGNFVVSLKAPLGVECRADLGRLCDRLGTPGAPLTFSENQLRGAYPALERDVDAFVASGRLACISEERGREPERVFARFPPGMPASAFLRDMWHAAKLPATTTDTERELVKRKILSREDVAVREARKKKDNEARAKEAALRAQAAREAARLPARVGVPISSHTGEIGALFEDSD